MGQIRYPKYLKANGILPAEGPQSIAFEPMIFLSGKDAESSAAPSLALTEEE
jgi:hypothetical protein